MTRPVEEWQWTEDPAIFWLRMEHLPPSRADLLRETYPPEDRPMRRHRSIRAKDLKAIREEAAQAAYVLNAPRRIAATERERTHELAGHITNRSTAVAERLLGINTNQEKDIA